MHLFFINNPSHILSQHFNIFDASTLGQYLGVDERNIPGNTEGLIMNVLLNSICTNLYHLIR
jgi:hypothetical protein